MSGLGSICRALSGMKYSAGYVVPLFTIDNQSVLTAGTHLERGYDTFVWIALSLGLRHCQWTD